MSESESEGGPQRPALPVPAEPHGKTTHNGPPATAAEYLRLVREQTAALPDIFISKTPAPPCKKRRRSYTPAPLPPPPEFAKPDPQWQRDLVFWFAELQRTVASFPSSEFHLPPKGDVDKWEKLLQEPPSFSMLLGMDYLAVVRLLRLLDDGIVVDDATGTEQLGQSIVEGFRAEWIFCLLSFVQPPISGGIATVIRSLLRKAAIEISSLEQLDNERLPTLNVLVTILGKYFRQEDAP